MDPLSGSHLAKNTGFWFGPGKDPPVVALFGSLAVYNRDRGLGCRSKLDRSRVTRNHC